MVNRVVKYGLGAVLCIAPVLLAPRAADATVSSEKRLSNGKVCRVIAVIPHHHLGIGSAYGSRAAARRSAIRRWSRFTAWEYGSEWGSYARAINKGVTCFPSLLEGGWRCVVAAQPCRR